MSDIAHVQLPSGGLVVPVDSPYDRQLLREHVETLVRPSGSLQLAVDGSEWTVMRLDDGEGSCTGCSQPLKFLHCSRTDGRAPVCLECVLCAAINDDRSEG